MMNHQHKGWSSFGFWYKDLAELERYWNVKVLPPQEDEHGVYYPCIKLEKWEEIQQNEALFLEHDYERARSEIEQG